MLPLYMTPAAISYLAQTIIALLVTVYLIYRISGRRGASLPFHIILLTGFFFAATLLLFSFFLEASLLPSDRLIVVYLQTSIVGLVITFLLQFAYHFPSLAPGRRWESRLVLVLTLLYMLFEMQFVVQRFFLLAVGQVEFRPDYADYPLVAGFFWTPIVLFRQAIWADNRPVAWWRKLYHPQGREATAAWAFALAYFLLAIVALLNVLRTFYFIPTNFYQLGLSIGILVTQFTVTAIYLNTLPETTTFMVRLVGLTLVTLLALLGAVGWVVAPAHAAGYLPRLTDHQTLRFTPNADGGYDVASSSFYFDSDLGTNLHLIDLVSGDMTVVDFVFPFYGRISRQIYVLDNGAVGIGAPLLYRNVQYHYGSVPAIFALYVDLRPEAGGGVFVRNDGDRLIVTWQQLPAFRYPKAIFTIQLRLYHDGVFEITYNGLPATLPFMLEDEPGAMLWVAGAVPGRTAQAPQLVNLANLPLHGGSQGLLQDYYLGFREHQHTILFPLALLVLAGSLLILVIFPSLFYFNLTRPLRTLLAGVQQINAGDLNVTIPMYYHDEIGFLAESFNAMSAQLRAQVANLEMRVADRTLDLATTNARLRTEIQEREAIQDQMVQQQRTLAALEERDRLGRELHDGLGQIMGYISLKVQTALTLLSHQQPLEMIQPHLVDLDQVAKEAYTDVRNYILGLRTTFSSQNGLCETIRLYLDQFSQLTGIVVKASFPAQQAALTFAPAVEEQVLRIIQEALTNVRKHASAHRVEVLINLMPDEAQFIITDDGVGFDLSASSPSPPEKGGGETRHFGLSIVRERAAQIGGRLEVRSSPGQGSQVILCVPRLTATATSMTADELVEIRGLRLLLVDDHPLFLDGLRNLLIARGLAVIGVARDGLEAQEQARALRPDVIVMDIQMPRCDGLEATRAIKAEQPNVKIVMLTVSEDEEHLFEAIRSGASGYLLKSLDANEFCQLLVSLMRGEVVLPPGMAARLLAEFARLPSPAPAAEDQPSAKPLTGLTARQWDILSRVSQGMTYKEIAADLHLSEPAIKYHMGQILDRLHLQTRYQAILYARRFQDSS